MVIYTSLGHYVFASLTRNEWRIYDDHKVIAPTHSEVVNMASTGATVAIYILDEATENLQEHYDRI